ncbi:MAG: Crp/Fnr family transcriptional regulator [Guyparkeria sp.]|uniref:Crp/Fnr family transcriptional regulator n=1 Tax=Guyparkeria sp. TaxID=2035736 RepID=UPI00397A3FE0
MTKQVVTGEELKQTALGKELGDEQCRLLASVCTRRAVANGEILFEEGHSSDTLFIVVRGRFAVSRDTGRGFSDTLHLLEAGQLAGESGFLDGTPHSATLRAVGDADVVMLDRAHLEALLIDHPILVYKVMRAIVYSVREIIRRMNRQHSELLSYINPGIGRF